ncbi:hypothetical protein SAMN02745121_08423 [Nannocystis exedens]|uniref:Uncharacterized protein n=1 Tax=Nannocystis exedens TaxID=54 RepID=A0A1I2I7H1_9BACT|nr:hypothetical protein [Nannocystis exedens]PCC74652.1 hypothetical protein NAEX_07749 [Nannocystis exedens]SFF37047.1 hypothetical protein SAMN02745121_08423 [Nannocystis exedens]
MEPSNRDPDVDERCPLCESPIAQDPHALDYCHACGCLLVEWSPRDDADDALPPGVTRRANTALTESDARGPYRVAAEEARLDILVEHRQQQFRAAAASAALFLVAVVTRSELPVAMTAGVVVLAVGGIAWSLIPRTSVMRFIATSDGLTVVGDGVPLHHGQHFVADDVEGVFVRALARSERPEDRRLELVLLERHGRRQSLLRGLDDPKTLSWIATHIERALGFEGTPGPPKRLGPGSSTVH